MKSMACDRQEVRLKGITILLEWPQSVFLHGCSQTGCRAEDGYVTSQLLWAVTFVMCFETSILNGGYQLKKHI